jgi:hypothetical protein
MSIDDAARIKSIRGKIAVCAEIYKKQNDEIKQKNATAKRKSEIIDIHRPDEMNPVLSEQDIQAFEDQYNIRIPEGYRLFLKEVGNGGVGGPANTGLFPLGLGKNQRPDLPFPLTDIWEWGIDDNVEPEDSAPAYRYGSISLCSFGGGEHARLIVNGPEYGNVWYISPEGAYYAEGPEATEDSEPTRLDFLHWYEYWLDDFLE